MQQDSYEQYEVESKNWLYRGRSYLIGKCVERYKPASTPLDILEVGAGVGPNIQTLNKFGHVDVTEIDQLGIQKLRESHEVRHLFTQPIPFELDARYDVICALDVLEHIENHEFAVEWMVDHLKTGGVAIFTVPAFQVLFSSHDEALHHFRRYTAKTLGEILPSSCRILMCTYFNSTLMGLAVVPRIPSILKHRLGLKPKQMTKMKSAVPQVVDKVFFGILKAESDLIDKGVRIPIGLSLVCVVGRD